MVSGAQGIQNAQAQIAAAQSEAAQYAKILGTPLSGNPTPAQLQQLMQAVAFFQALENNGSYTTSSGQVINFGQFGKAGIFGDQTSGFIAALNKVLADFGGKVTIQVPSQFGDNTTATIMDAQGKPATLAEIIANPNEKFTFQYPNAEFGGGSVNWSKGSIYGGSGTVTQDQNGNTIPGGGLSYNEDSGCTYDNINVSGTGAAILDYINFAPSGTNSSINADGAALGQYIGQNL